MGQTVCADARAAIDQNVCSAPSEEAIDAVITAVCKQDRYREVMYRMLMRCQAQPLKLDDLESFIASLPQSRHAIQTPGTLIDLMVKAGGLVARELDEDGATIPVELLETLDEESREDLVFDWQFETTPAGAAAVSILSPAVRLQSKLNEKPQRYSTYLAVLDFCSEPRSLSDVQRLFRQDSSLVRDTMVDSQSLAPDFYLNELERSGGLVWDGGWKITDAGSAYLAQARTVDREN